MWFAGVCHALNLLDNMDGLAAGVALIATLFLAFLLGKSLGPGLVLLLTALAGALVGFLYWNRPPARLFMGDSGSLFIGAVLASASLVPVFNTGIAFVSPAVLVVFILIVPIFDTAFVLVLRRLAGRKASKGGTDHVSHRLASLGFSERSAVRILYALGLAGGAIAWELTTGPGIEPMALVAVFGVLLILFGIFLARVPGLQRPGLHRAAEVVVRAAAEGPGVPLARGRGAAGPGADHRVLLRRLPHPLRGTGLR